MNLRKRDYSYFFSQNPIERKTLSENHKIFTTLRLLPNRRIYSNRLRSTPEYRLVPRRISPQDYDSPFPGLYRLMEHANDLGFCGQLMLPKQKMFLELIRPMIADLAANIDGKINCFR